MTTDLSPSFVGRRVLITGRLGFIGSNLARRLVGYGAVVTLADSLIPEYGGNLYNIAGIEERVRVNICDVRDEHSMRYLVQGQDYLFNLAGQTSHLDIGDYYADDRCIRQTLGWEPQVPLADGLRRTLAFYRENLEHYL